MALSFFEQPIINTPYAPPGRHWELDADGQPTNRLLEHRRRSSHVTPFPKGKKTGAKGQAELDLAGGAAEAGEQAYNPTPIINDIREAVAAWRALPNPVDWGVTPETARLLQHWRQHDFQNQRPFFCQIEAVETAIWLTEVAPKLGRRTAKFWAHIEAGNAASNPELVRLALKMATGAGKTTVMAMLIAWQTVNAVRRPGSRSFSRGFLIVTPGITIKDRLRVLLPNDADSYYRTRELVPSDLVGDIDRAKIVVTNFHAFKRRERFAVSKIGRSLLKGRGDPLDTLETEGQMLQRVMPDLMGMKGIVAINDEAHHCYRERPAEEGEDEALDTDGKDEAKRNNEYARLWISGLEAAKRSVGLNGIFDLSATPFFLRGSGYREGTLFPWTVSDFSLMDAIECGIVKLPRIPVSDNLPGGDPLVYRNLWDHIGKNMPKKGRAKSASLDPLEIQPLLQSALEALYGHYAKTFAVWQAAKLEVPPVFIVVCNNTATSKLVFDYIAGFHRPPLDGKPGEFVQGRLPLFRNFDDEGRPLPRSNTLLIDSEQLESGEALDAEFRAFAAEEIELFKREKIERTGDRAAADKLTDQDLLREVMNTVGKPGRLGEGIRCVVSVAMLTEGWDANTVTHILGLRAFGTQLLCEQVVGRGLRRRSYHLNAEGFFDVEYADVLGIPFDFTGKPVVAKPVEPKPTVRVQSLPERDDLEIVFPRVAGYRFELPNERLSARFTEESRLRLTPELVGPSIVRNEGIIGEGVTLTVEHLKEERDNTLAYHLAHHLLLHQFREPGEAPRLYLFGQLKRIAEDWLKGGFLTCQGETARGQLRYPQIADLAASRIYAAISLAMAGDKRIKALLDPYNPRGSTRFVDFVTSRAERWKTAPDKCPINWVVLDSDWEAQLCQVLEAHPRVLSYAKNHGLYFEVPYRLAGQPRRYRPDFLVRLDDGHPDPLTLVAEVKGFRGEDAKEKASTMARFWVPGVNALGSFGRWAFAEFTDPHTMRDQISAIAK